jgi:hypothetical protein
MDRHPISSASSLLGADSMAASDVAAVTGSESGREEGSSSLVLAAPHVEALKSAELTVEAAALLARRACQELAPARSSKEPVAGE